MSSRTAAAPAPALSGSEATCQPIVRNAPLLAPTVAAPPLWV